MPASLENSAMATELQKVNYHFNPKETQYQRMFKLPYNCAYFTFKQDNDQNSSSKASKVHELKTSRCSDWV